MRRRQQAHQATAQAITTREEAERARQDEELDRLQAVHQKENAALSTEVSRQADTFESTSSPMMIETSRVRGRAKMQTDRLARELAQNRDVVDPLRVQRSEFRRKAQSQVPSAELGYAAKSNATIL
jgi:hypothetical protein